MSDLVLERYILEHYKPTHHYKITDTKIIINTQDLIEFMKDIRSFATYDYNNSTIYFLGRRIVTYSTDEEYLWAVILQ